MPDGNHVVIGAITPVDWLAIIAAAVNAFIALLSTNSSLSALWTNLLAWLQKTFPFLNSTWITTIINFIKSLFAKPNNVPKACEAFAAAMAA
jgi:hypothetical protein